MQDVQGDAAWVLGSAWVILTMQAGFAMLEAGLTSMKSQSNILMKNLADMSFGSVAWFMTGWALAYGKGGGWFAGASEFFLVDTTDYVSWVFQYAFAATASTILSGAVAGRMKFTIYLALSTFVTGFAYPIGCHWAWDASGWLAKLGYHDFAGCGPIHMLGGVMGICGSIALGPRLGVFTTDGSYLPVRSSTVHTIFGTFILVWGWFAFNTGSTLGISEGWYLVAGKVGANTAIACGGATVVTVFMSLWASKGETVDVFETTAGALAGLVAITAPCAVVEPYEALVIGCLGAIIAYRANTLLVKYRIDDPVGVFPVHVVGGAVGLLCVGLFSSANDTIGNKAGLFHGGGFYLLGVQAAGTCAFTFWGVLTSFAFMYCVSRITPLRVSALAEQKGLDLTEHSLVGMVLFESANNAPLGAGGRKPEGPRRSSLVNDGGRESLVYTKAEIEIARQMYIVSQQTGSPGSAASGSPAPTKPASSRVVPAGLSVDSDDADAVQQLPSGPQQPGDGPVLPVPVPSAGVVSPTKQRRHSTASQNLSPNTRRRQSLLASVAIHEGLQEQPSDATGRCGMM